MFAPYYSPGWPPHLSRAMPTPVATVSTGWARVFRTGSTRRLCLAVSLFMAAPKALSSLRRSLPVQVMAYDSSTATKTYRVSSDPALMTLSLLPSAINQLFRQALALRMALPYSCPSRRPTRKKRDPCISMVAGEPGAHRDYQCGASPGAKTRRCQSAIGVPVNSNRHVRC